MVIVSTSVPVSGLAGSVLIARVSSLPAIRRVWWNRSALLSLSLSFKAARPKPRAPGRGGGPLNIRTQRRRFRRCERPAPAVGAFRRHRSWLHPSRWLATRGVSRSHIHRPFAQPFSRPPTVHLPVHPPSTSVPLPPVHLVHPP